MAEVVYPLLGGGTFILERYLCKGDEKNFHNETYTPTTLDLHLLPLSA